MGAQANTEHSITAKGLYIRTGVGVLGPYDTEALRTMVKNGVLPRSGAVSVDGKSWRRADQVSGLFSSISTAIKDKKSKRYAEKNISASSELKRLLNIICENRFYKFVQPITVYASGIILLVVALAASYFLSGLNEYYSFKRLVLFSAFAIPLSVFLVGISASMLNWIIGKALRLTRREKEFLSIHLPLHVFNRLGWGRFMKNWLYGSNWLIESCDESPVCYVHLFKTGEPLGSIEEDVTLWKRLSASLPYSLRNLCIPGETIRQVQTTKSLPKWSKSLSEVTDGYAIGGILDDKYVEWAKTFLTRARKRLSLPESAAVDFFLTYFDISSESEVLAVCVFPRSVDETLDDSGEENPSGTIAA